MKQRTATRPRPSRATTSAPKLREVPPPDQIEETAGTVSVEIPGQVYRIAIAAAALDELGVQDWIVKVVTEGVEGPLDRGIHDAEMIGTKIRNQPAV